MQEYRTKSLVLRTLRPEDESEALAAQRALEAASFPFLLGWEPQRQSWTEYLAHRENQRLGRELDGRWVPSTFLVATCDDVIVGRISIRHELDDFLSRFGGHIGYAVLPEFRGRGYATEMLRGGIEIAAELGIESALLTCDDDNLASARVIERCGGRLESLVEQPTGGPLLRRYWIDTAPSD